MYTQDYCVNIHNNLGICKRKYSIYLVKSVYFLFNLGKINFMTTQQIFINNLKAYRKQAGFTQAQLAVLIDKSFNYINGIECGVSFPPPDVIDKIAETLKIKPMQLFNENCCVQNIVGTDKDLFIENLSQKIFVKLEPSIKADIESGIKSALSL